MERLSTTPFGRRPVTAGLLAAQALAGAEPPCPTADKWELLRDLCAARAAFGISDRDLTVLNALLSFHPGPTLEEGALIVFPSNAALSDRAHGMSESTLRRHLAALVAARLILRHDSPNGKRYCARGPGGAILRAFGFDLRPLLVRAAEIRAAARSAREAALRLKLMREAVSLMLRDATKLAEYGRDHLPANWTADLDALHEARKALRRRLDFETIAGIRDELEARLATIAKRIETAEMGGSDNQTDRHLQNSDTDVTDSEWGEEVTGSNPEPQEPETTRLPLGLVRKACPELALYAGGEIVSWPQLVTAARRVSPMMGVTPSAWAEAENAMGPPAAAVTLACMLERMDRIRSPGAYLRSLSRKAAEGAFSPGPMVMSLLKAAA